VKHDTLPGTCFVVVANSHLLHLLLLLLLLLMLMLLLLLAE
jgi:hypothetical protein